MDYRDLPYDAEIEYLESTGTQYIDTGIIPTNKHGFRISCYVPRNAGGGSYNDRVIGVHGTARWLLSIHDNSRATFFGWNDAYSNLGIYYNTNVVADLNYLNNRKGVINNVTKIDTLPTLGSIAESAYLFGNRNVAASFIGRISACTITYESEIIIDFIPVRVGQVGYMYDKVSGQLFGNSGTGSFVLGSDVAPGRKANDVAFLESWGNQYIDTGIKPSTNTKIELKCLYCKSGVGLTNYGALIGADDRSNAYTLTHSDMANFTFGESVSRDFANPQTRLLTFDSTASSNNMKVYDEGGSLITTLSCIRGIFEINQNLYLFAINRNGTPVYGSNRILYCKIYDGDTLVRDYVPVEYNGIGYMYDKVSGLFFNNKGTGKFLFGSIAKACARSYTRRQLMAKAPVPLEKQYLTFKVLSEGTITAVSNDSKANSTIQYSLNGGRWQSLTISTTSQSLGTFNIDDEIRIKGNNSNYSSGLGGYCHFGGTAQTEVKGNIMSLVYGDNFAGKTVLTANYTFNSLFTGWTNLVSAEDLIMPAMTLRYRCYIYLFKGCSSLQKTPKVLPATDLVGGCYQEMFMNCKKIVYPPVVSAINANGGDCCKGMFDSCTTLREAPDLNATKLSTNCYSHMFNSCTSLTSAPELPATTLASSCYDWMFTNCKNLTTAPSVLPATTLVSGCYNYMFYGCSKIKYIKAMFTTTPTATYTKSWVDGVASSGTFVKNSAATWDVRGVHGIPNNWTVQTADE